MTRTTKLGRATRALAAALTATGLATTAMLTLGVTQALALGPGEVCVFDQPAGARIDLGLGSISFGHVGWGFRIAGSDQWIYGSTENPNGDPDIPRGGFNGAWHHQGTKAQMVADFIHQPYYPSHQKDPRSKQSAPTHPYQSYKCETTTSVVGAASNVVNSMANAGYDVVPAAVIRGVGGPKGNCMDHAYRILSAYGAPNLSSPTVVLPKWWYESLGPWPNTGWIETTLAEEGAALAGTAAT